MRNSDPDAAVYWLARMVEAGEDPIYIARRLVRFASEDVGNADPQALTVAVAAKDAVHFIGMPEGNTALAQAAIYLATAPKSNAVYMAYSAAAEAAQNDVAAPVPLHLRNAPTRLMKQLDYGKGYRYAHDEADAVAKWTACRRTCRVGSSTSRPTAASRRRSRSGSPGGSRNGTSQSAINPATPFGPQPGDRIGHYEIVSPAWPGGMGEVYRALDTRLGRAVAIKVLPAQLAGRSRAARPV